MQGAFSKCTRSQWQSRLDECWWRVGSSEIISIVVQNEIDVTDEAKKIKDLAGIYENSRGLR